jgi:outer membrane protein OmpA-like peptidoglycan-associated protein
VSEIFGAVIDSPPLPDGLVPVGDCPPGGGTAAQEVSAQAEAIVPLKPGLTMAYLWTRTPREEYECLIQVQSADNDGITTTASCDVPERPDVFLRRVCRTDLRSARLLHTLYGTHKAIGPSGEDLPETIVGATAFSLSSAAFAELKRTGSTSHHYVELNQHGRLQKEGVGLLRVEGREMMTVLVNDRPMEVPVVKTRGHLKWWIRGKRLETQDQVLVLDDERFPLLIDQDTHGDSAASRIRFAKISYPNKGGQGSGAGGGGQPGSGGLGLEGRLGRNEPVDVYGIYFDFNSDRIRIESEPVLQEIGDIMRRHPDWGLNINGHTDNIGGDGPANLDLSRRRSEAVRKALTSRFGIAADRLSSGGHGASAPKDTNDTPEGRARNRRVELTRR